MDGNIICPWNKENHLLDNAKPVIFYGLRIEEDIVFADKQIIGDNASMLE